MTEILTESFCERCGTRYTFESSRPRIRLQGVKVLSRGLKNFVLSDDTSIDEAMAAARSEADREASSHQLDAFHKTFSFCMSCRQYTCPNCWNEAEARCLSCAPLALPEMHDLRELREAVFIGEPTPGNGAPASEADHSVWPTLAEPELEAAAEVEAEPQLAFAAEFEVPTEAPIEIYEEVTSAELARPEESIGAAEVEAEPEPAIAAEVEAEPEPAIAAEVEAEPEPAIAAEVEAEPEPAIAAEDLVVDSDEAITEAGDPMGKAASQTLGLLRRFRPGQSLDAELDAFERERGDVASLDAAAESAAPTDDLGALHAERMAAASRPEEPEVIEAATEPAIEPLPETPDSADVAASGEAPTPIEDAEVPEPVEAAAPGIGPAPEPELTPEEPAAPPLAAATATADVVEQPTWRIMAPDPTGPAPLPSAGDKGGSVPVQAKSAQQKPTGAPQWPAQPEWPSATASAGLPFLGRPATPQGGIDALWAASNQELVTAPPVPGKPASGIQPCISCGLSLSANARFCRRCGTPQSR